MLRCSPFIFIIFQRLSQSLQTIVCSYNLNQHLQTETVLLQMLCYFRSTWKSCRFSSWGWSAPIDKFILPNTLHKPKRIKKQQQQMVKEQDLSWKKTEIRSLQRGRGSCLLEMAHYPETKSSCTRYSWSPMSHKTWGICLDTGWFQHKNRKIMRAKLQVSPHSHLQNG